MKRIELKVEHSEPSAEDLAIQLAQALQGASQYQLDHESYVAQARSERRKVRDLDDLIRRVKRYRANPPVQRRRMDPMFEYDLDKLAAERTLAHDRAIAFQETADEARKRADQHRVRAAALQEGIQALRRKKAG